MSQTQPKDEKHCDLCVTYSRVIAVNITHQKPGGVVYYCVQ